MVSYKALNTIIDVLQDGSRKHLEIVIMSGRQYLNYTE